MQVKSDHSLWDRIFCRDTTGCSISDTGGTIQIAELARASTLSMPLAAFCGRSVLLAARDQMPAALALLELDGIAARITLCPPDVPNEHVEAVAAEANAEMAIIGPADQPSWNLEHLTLATADRAQIRPLAVDRHQSCIATEWILLTSGTTGVPKLVRHSLATLAGPIDIAAPPDPRIVWSTFYDIRRYGGLQIYLRGMLGGGSLVLTSGHEPLADTLCRLTKSGVTHISGTPSHWRRVLMSRAIGEFAPGNVRLSGEIADQTILERLKTAFPNARIVHAFASTEAGVGFEVTDRREGFPAAMVGRQDGAVRIKVADGTLRLKSAHTADRYLGATNQLTDDDGYVDTGDLVELRGDRYFFIGRRGGIINVGGQKVHPEEVEAVINQHPAVHSSLVKSRKSPVIGAVVVAEVVLKQPASTAAEVESEIRASCLRELAAHKVPAIIRFVPALAVTPGGKLMRNNT